MLLPKIFVRFKTSLNIFERNTRVKLNAELYSQFLHHHVGLRLVGLHFWSSPLGATSNSGSSLPLKFGCLSYRILSFFLKLFSKPLEFIEPSLWAYFSCLVAHRISESDLTSQTIILPSFSILVWACRQDVIKSPLISTRGHPFQNCRSTLQRCLVLLNTPAVVSLILFNVFGVVFGCAVSLCDDDVHDAMFLGGLWFSALGLSSAPD